ncbi:methyltransferase [Acrocarpospora pleiomorpha]|uniref:Methyltransferase n=1 Tax=Acrocarpospora pleiomorpha TaxID=90975 RepID=A0A5M3XH35_9ACTN|nr:class I SAM-dependent methyltransferase [Acrocarpospora pleiomorpha]GES20837.1 methyltransferase [Acrocarpospora pleiomorpha]
MLSHDHAHAWIERWDRQQEGYLPDREERFTALIDAIETGRPDPVVIDLGCGPGSLSARLLNRLPDATVIAVDTDPLLLALGRAEYDGLPGLRFVDRDLRIPGWTEALDLPRPADVAVSTTALHWLPEDQLKNVYAELAGALRPGGMFLNGDHLAVADTAPRLDALERALGARAAERLFAEDPPEDWASWWAAVSADPEFEALNLDRDRRKASAGHHGSESGLLSTHVNALRAAGFTEIGALWQRGNDRLLCALLS